MSLLWRAVSAEQGAQPWSSALRGREEWLPFSARLQSRDEGLWFNADFEMSLRCAGRSRLRRQAAAGSARVEVLEYAWKIAGGYSVADVGIAEADISRRLLEEDVVSDPEITFGSVSVRLTADDEDVQLVKEKERWAQRSAIQAEEHRARMQHLERLTTDVYSDPAVALRWWYDCNPSHTGDLEMAADRLKLVMADGYEAAGGSAAVEASAGLVSELLRGLDCTDRAAVLDRLAMLFSGFGRHDLAKLLRDQGAGERGGGEAGARSAPDGAV